jgi:hypothetical protein
MIPHDRLDSVRELKKTLLHSKSPCADINSVRDNHSLYSRQSLLRPKKALPGRGPDAEERASKGRTGVVMPFPPDAEIIHRKLYDMNQKVLYDLGRCITVGDSAPSVGAPTRSRRVKAKRSD